jgi:hypothetical protein
MANRVPLPKGFSSWTPADKVAYVLSDPDIAIMCSMLERANMCGLGYTEFHRLATSPAVLSQVGDSCRHQLLMAQPAITRASIQYAVSSIKASSDRRLLLNLLQPKDGEGGNDFDPTEVLRQLMSEDVDKDFID